MRFSLDTYCVNIDSTIKEAMECIDRNLTGAAFIVTDEYKLKGIITDGVIRRAILKGSSLDSKIEGIYSRDFKYIKKFESRKKVKDFMINNSIRQVPLLNDLGEIKEIYFLDDMLSHSVKDNYVFILAGGLGTRLRPLTDNIPKPMLNVGDTPILERIILQFKEYGYRNFIISINYKGEIIEDYFKDGKDFGVNIEYVKETKKLGTAGSISLAREKFKKPFIVINGDILTSIDFDKFLSHHVNNGFDITVGVRSYEIKVPYGVIVTDNNNIKSLKEKPTYTYYINGGVYALDNSMIKYIPDNEEYNMTELIEHVIEKSNNAGVYKINEYWSDIGQMDDYKRANEEVDQFF